MWPIFKCREKKRWVEAIGQKQLERYKNQKQYVSIVSTLIQTNQVVVGHSGGQNGGAEGGVEMMKQGWPWVNKCCIWMRDPWCFLDIILFPLYKWEIFLNCFLIQSRIVPEIVEIINLLFSVSIFHSFLKIQVFTRRANTYHFSKKKKINPK